MPRVTKPLTDTQIKQAKPKAAEYSLSDGNGLALRVKPSGTKSWLFNYYVPFTKKRTNISLGIYPDVSLSKARDERQGFRSLLADHIDPAEHRKQQEANNTLAHSNTLENVYRQWLTTKQDKSASYLHRLTKALELHIIPALGNTPVHKINAPDTIKVLQPIAERQALETVRKLARWLNEVMTFAVNTGLVHSNPLSGISKAFKAPKVENRPTIKPEELPDFLKTLDSAQVTLTTRCLIEWLLHTMVRPGEAAGAKWTEINFETKLWVIPAERMKQRRDHIVPLTKHTLAILDTMKPISAHREYIFPSAHKPRESINNSSANMALKRMGYKGQLVAHGLRSLASTILNEQEFSHDVIEAALAHVDSNSIRATYNRAEYLEQRRKMMNWWSDHIEQCASREVPQTQGKNHVASLTPDNTRGIPKTDTHKINMDKQKQRGGPRQGAGRKKELTFTEKLALVNEVTLLQRQQPGLTQDEALNKLKSEKKIKPQNRRTYLTPAHFNKEAKAILLESEREGILSVLPRLTAKDPL